eukprot:5682192-Lingulodinium_polyedra.AAC.1
MGQRCGFAAPPGRPDAQPRAGAAGCGGRHHSAGGVRGQRGGGRGGRPGGRPMPGRRLPGLPRAGHRPQGLGGPGAA